MNQSNHQSYYIDRAASSRALSQRAVNPAIAAIHAELAVRYDALATQTHREVPCQPIATGPAGSAQAT